MRTVWNLLDQCMHCRYDNATQMRTMSHPESLQRKYRVGVPFIYPLLAVKARSHGRVN